MNIHELRRQVDNEVIDYNMLLFLLREYSHPRGKISQWLKKGELIRVKKGLYVFGQEARRFPYSKEVLANLIYGPSAISLQYALSYYGLIPERVQAVTSITNKRNKSFQTPVGDFSYRFLSPDKFAIGINLLTTTSGVHFLMASPEKAICDLIALDVKGVEFTSLSDFEYFLFDDLRIEPESVKKLNKSDMTRISQIYHNSRLSQFIDNYLEWVEKNA